MIKQNQFSIGLYNLMLILWDTFKDRKSWPASWSTPKLIWQIYWYHVLIRCICSSYPTLSSCPRKSALHFCRRYETVSSLRLRNPLAFRLYQNNPLYWILQDQLARQTNEPLSVYWHCEVLCLQTFTRFMCFEIVQYLQLEFC